MFTFFFLLPCLLSFSLPDLFKLVTDFLHCPESLLTALQMHSSVIYEGYI